MKILFYRYNSICEPDILSTFREFGYTVTEYTAEMTKKDLKPSDTVKAVSELLQKDPADAVFSINYYPALSEVCNLFHIRYISWTVDSPVPELYHPSIRNEWNRTFIFDKEDYLEIKKICEGSDKEHVFYRPLAARVAPKDELFKRSGDDVHKRYAHDISFVGSLYTEKSPYRKVRDGLSDTTLGYLEGIMRAQMKVCGYSFTEEIINEDIIRDFKEHVPDFFEFGGTDHFWDDKKTIARYYLAPEITAMQREYMFKVLSGYYNAPGDGEGLKTPGQSGFSIYTGSDVSSILYVKNIGRCNTLTEMPLIFRNSKININTTSYGIRSGLPLRIFDILSCGGFVLTNYQNDIPEVFTIGEDLAAYTSEEEMILLADYYLSHEDERSAIAEHGYETLKNNNSYEKVLGMMLLKAFE